MLSYFDVKNFASRVQCPVYMSFGLQDPTCPPHTNFSIYNNLGTKDKRFFCVPTCGHAMWQEPSWSEAREAFLLPYLQ
jgi:cephalosporin-C deacetylase